MEESFASFTRNRLRGYRLSSISWRPRRITGQFSVTNPWEGERDFQVAHSSFRLEPPAPGVCYLAEKSRTLETDIFSRSDIHPRRREWLGSAFVKDPLTVAFCIYAPAQDRPGRGERACSGKKFDLKPLRKKRRRANEGEERRGLETKGGQREGVGEGEGGEGGGGAAAAAETSGIEYVCT